MIVTVQGCPNLGKSQLVGRMERECMGVRAFDQPDISKHQDAFTYILHRMMEYREATLADNDHTVCISTCDPFFDREFCVPCFLENEQLTGVEAEVLRQVLEGLITQSQDAVVSRASFKEPDCRVGMVAQEHDALSHVCLYLNVLTAPLGVRDIARINDGVVSYCADVVFLHTSCQYNVPLWTDLKLQFKDLLMQNTQGKVRCRQYRNALKANILNLGTSPP